MPPHRITDPKEIENYFWERVNQTDTCWLWTGALSHSYGVLGLRALGTNRLAHRYSYELHYGPIPDGLHVLHQCDQPACCRPDHLFLGTQSDNMKDAGEKGRMKKGVEHHNSKLTPEDIPEILRLRSLGLSYPKIVKLFGVDQHTIGYVCRGQTWSWIPR